MIKHKSLLLLLPVFISLACHKANENTEHLAIALKKYFAFDTGTYWIMHDSISNSNEYLEVFQHHNYIVPSDDENENNQEKTDIRISDTSAIGSGTYQWILTLLRTDATILECTDDRSNTLGNWNFTGSVPFKLTEYTYLIKYPALDSGKYLSEHYEKYSCNSREYLDVYHVFRGTKSSFIDIYFNSKDGLIKLKAHNKRFEKNLSVLEKSIKVKSY